MNTNTLTKTSTNDLRALLASLRSQPAHNIPVYLSQIEHITQELDRRSH